VSRGTSSACKRSDALCFAFFAYFTEPAAALSLPSNQSADRSECQISFGVVLRSYHLLLADFEDFESWKVLDFAGEHLSCIW